VLELGGAIGQIAPIWTSYKLAPFGLKTLLNASQCLHTVIDLGSTSWLWRPAPITVNYW